MDEPDEFCWEPHVPKQAVDPVGLAASLRAIAELLDAGPLPRHQSKATLSLLYADLVDLRLTFTEYKKRRVRLIASRDGSEQWSVCDSVARDRRGLSARELRTFQGTDVALKLVSRLMGGEPFATGNVAVLRKAAELIDSAELPLEDGNTTPALVSGNQPTCDGSNAPPVGADLCLPAFGKPSPTEQFAVDALREIGHRVTGGPLSYKAWNRHDGGTKAMLASLVKHRHLTNRPETSPRGYGLPEWA